MAGLTSAWKSIDTVCDKVKTNFLCLEYVGPKKTREKIRKRTGVRRRSQLSAPFFLLPKFQSPVTLSKGDRETKTLCVCF